MGIGDPEAFTIDTVPGRFAEIGDPVGGDGPAPDAVGGLDRLLMLAEEMGPPERAPKGARTGKTGNTVDARRVGAQSAKPLIEVARTKTRDEAMVALDTWRDRYPAAAGLLQPADVLVRRDARARSSIWYRDPDQPAHARAGRPAPAAGGRADRRLQPLEGREGEDPDELRGADEP